MTDTSHAAADRVATRIARRGLFGDGIALSASAFLASAAGLIGWLIATRMVGRAQVGTAAAFVNSFIMVATIAELGLGPALLRWVPRAGEQARVLVKRAYTVVCIGALIAGALWFFAAGSLVIAGPAMLFILACVGWTLFQFQDQVLTGIGAARWVPLENLIFSAIRLLLLVPLGNALGAGGIVLSWVLPCLFAVLVVSTCLWLADRSARATGRHSRPRATSAGTLPSRGQVIRFLAPTYPATVFLAVLYNVAPLFVTARFGLELGAVFFVVWMGLNTLDLAATGFVNALVIRLAAQAGSAPSLIRHAATRLAVVFVPMLVVAVVMSGWVLGLFGAEYANEGGTLLRLVILAFPARLVSILIVGVHLAAGRAPMVAALQAVNAALTIAVIALVPTGSLAPIGVGFIGVQVLVASIATVDVLRRMRSGPAQAAESVAT